MKVFETYKNLKYIAPELFGETMPIELSNHDIIYVSSEIISDSEAHTMIGQMKKYRYDDLTTRREEEHYFIYITDADNPDDRVVVLSFANGLYHDKNKNCYFRWFWVVRALCKSFIEQNGEENINKAVEWEFIGKFIGKERVE